eukprot:m.138828 g.138828  ORF g.138828 m.138828 type:complete len:136 (+) comp9970_c1_seq3:956-1363(+)
MRAQERNMGCVALRTTTHRIWRARYCRKNGIQFQAYSPLGYVTFAGANELSVLKNPILQTIADKHDRTTAQVALQWCVQRGVSTMPMSLKESEMKENLLAGSWSLDDEDMEVIKSLDQGYHYLNPERWYGLPLWD